MINVPPPGCRLLTDLSTTYYLVKATVIVCAIRSSHFISYVGVTSTVVLLSEEINHLHQIMTKYLYKQG